MKLHFLLSCIIIASTAYSQNPTLISFSPKTSNFGDTISVLGNNFRLNSNEFIVQSSGIFAQTIPVSSTMFKFIAPFAFSGEKISYSDFNNTVFSNDRLILLFNGDTRINESSFTSSTASALASKQTSYMDKCDFDHDGRLDLVLASESEKKLTVLRNISAIPYAGDQVTVNSFSLGTKLNTDTFTYGVFTCDLNNDGWHEIITTSEHSGQILIFENLKISGTINQASFAAPIRIDVPANSSTEVAFADFNQDGKIDLAVTSADSSKIFIYKNTSSQNTLNPSTFELIKTIEVGNCNPIGVLGIKCADFNDDNKTDIVTTLQCTNQLVVIPNEGLFTFGTPVKITLDAQPVCVETADMNNDNKQDILVSLKDYGLAVLTNLNKSTTLDSLSFTKQNIALKAPSNRSLTWQIKVADFNGDGKLDVSLNSLFCLTLFKNTSSDGAILDSNTIQQSTIWGLPSFAYGHVIGDFNLDGRSDIIITTQDQFAANGNMKFLTNTIGHPVGINTIKKEVAFLSEIYPNPANNHTTVQSIHKIKQVNILNSMGQLKQTVNAKAELTLTIDVSALTEGIYTLEIIHQNGIVSTQKLCIQK